MLTILPACRPAPITIRAGLLLDGRGGSQRDALVTVAGGRIRAVEPWQGTPVTHDLSRYTVLPGLIDAHVHISGYVNRAGKLHTPGDGETPAQEAAGRAANALATLQAGFTTVASVGPPSDVALREAIERDAIPGPRIVTSLGGIRDSSLSLRELRREVLDRRRAGADYIKVFASGANQRGGLPTFSLEQLSTICAEAKRLRLRTMVHAVSDASIRLVVEAGCDQVEHGFLATPAGLGVLAEQRRRFDPQCGLVFRNYLAHPKRVAGIAGFDSSGMASFAAMLPMQPALIRRALATPGLKLVFGTDAVAGAHGRNADDLVCRVREAGQSPMDALVTATSRNAEALGLDDELGRIAPGYRADLIALDGDPLQEIEAVQRVKFVMKGGKVFLSP